MTLADAKALKGSRFLLLRGFENLSVDAVDHLWRLMELNEPLYQAYLLKEELRTFWSLPSAEVGCNFLRQWTKQAKDIDNRHFERLADTLNRNGLLPTSNTQSPPAHSKALTTTPKSSNGKPTAFGTSNTSSCASTPFTRPKAFSPADSRLEPAFQCDAVDFPHAHNKKEKR